MSKRAIPTLLGAAAALALLLAVGCSSTVNPDVSRLGDGGAASAPPPGPTRTPPGDGGACPPSYIRCGALCVDPARDLAHCGGCGHSCEARCISGVCR